MRHGGVVDSAGLLQTRCHPFLIKPYFQSASYLTRDDLVSHARLICLPVLSPSLVGFIWQKRGTQQVWGHFQRD